MKTIETKEELKKLEELNSEWTIYESYSEDTT